MVALVSRGQWAYRHFRHLSVTVLVETLVAEEKAVLVAVALVVAVALAAVAVVVVQAPVWIQREDVVEVKTEMRRKLLEIRPLIEQEKQHKTLLTKT
jgi:hypothetical protein